MVGPAETRPVRGRPSTIFYYAFLLSFLFKSILRAQINKNKFASNLLWNILWFAKARESVNLSLIFSKRV